ncbi:MAG TPA: potassium channel protein [Terriglobales bacterium]|nr:potassium channel protein [Terriglobales bacterium]
MRGYRNLQLIFSALVVVCLIGALGFHVIEGWSWFDSFYMVLMTITTIGYSEVHPLSHAGKEFNVFVMIFGVGLVFLGIGATASALLEFELLSFFGKRRMEREISGLSRHYVICGAGRVGRSVARELQRESVPLVIIEANEEKAAKFSDQGWLTVIGDATQESVLRQVHIETARGLVAAASTDAINLYVVLTARSMNPGLRIIARASEEDAGKHLRTAGADEVISPYLSAGHRIAQSFLRPNVLDFLDIATARGGKLDLEIEEIRIEPDSPFAGNTIAGSRIRQELNVIVLAIKGPRGMRFNPAPEDRIDAGDCLIAMGEPAGLRRLEQTAAAHP